MTIDSIRARRVGSVKMRIQNTCTALAVLMITFAGRRTGAGEEPTYPFQQDVEVHLKGAAAENRAYALLLPLRVGLMSRKEQEAYRLKILKHIDENDMKEALPLLEDALRWDCFYLETGERLWAAEIWVRLKTKDMGEAARADFLVSTLRPGYGLRVHEKSSIALMKMGDLGRRKLVDMLSGIDGQVLTENDLLIAAAMESVLTNAASPLQDAELDQLLRSSNPYVRFLCQRALVARRDKRAASLALELLKVPGLTRYRHRMCMGLSSCPGGEKVFVEVLRTFRGEPPTVMREREILLILSIVFGAQTGEFRSASQELKDAVRAIVDREIKPMSPHGLDADFFRQQWQNREMAKLVLGEWTRKENLDKKGAEK